MIFNYWLIYKSYPCLVLRGKIGQWLCYLVVISPWNLERQRLLKWLDKYVHDEYTASTPQLYHEHLNANAEQTDHWTWNKLRIISLKIGFLSKEWSLKTKIGVWLIRDLPNFDPAWKLTFLEISTLLRRFVLIRELLDQLVCKCNWAARHMVSLNP